jgi:1,4-alpha-glucan branching enzyme
MSDARLPDLLQRRLTHFVLWARGARRPSLYLGRFEANVRDPFASFREIPLAQGDHADLWQLRARDCGLEDGAVYLYWFLVQDTNPYDPVHRLLYVTDPTAWTVDRWFTAPAPAHAGGTASLAPAGVLCYRQGRLEPCDSDGRSADWEGDAPLENLPPNNRLVIYELPTRWVRRGHQGSQAVGVGTFRDVLAQVERDAIAPGFAELALGAGRTHLLDLGVNALELLPPADSDDDLGWGYGTANFLAPSYQLGRPAGQRSSSASTDLVTLIKACHQHGIRFFYDAVMAFSRDDSYRHIDFSDFHVQWGAGDPEQGGRDGFGGDLFKFATPLHGYDPVRGVDALAYPARQFMKVHIAHWLTYYRIDGIRVDSVNNIDNYDFVGEWKDYARSIWQQRGGQDDRFLVVGEELSLPGALLRQRRLDGLWNEAFKRLVRCAVLGCTAPGEPSFESTVRKLIDCRLVLDGDGQQLFTDGAQAVNYITSHDIGGPRNERIYNFLLNNQVFDTEPRIKLAFACLLTAVGIPMILAGEEFADPQDATIGQPGAGQDRKQIDPLDYGLMEDEWRRRLFDYVARLVRLRTSSPALMLNDTSFIHADFEDGKQVVAWQRGRWPDLVVVVANFSDYRTPGAGPDNLSAEYRVGNWPSTPPGRAWREVTQDRAVPPEWIGREPIFPWEAKVYVTS